jgi:hypothetical protein
MICCVLTLEANNSADKILNVKFGCGFFLQLNSHFWYEGELINSRDRLEKTVK